MSDLKPENGDAGDVLAARLLAAHRELAGLKVSPEVRSRLNLRFAAICAALKLPEASPVSCTRRLDRLLADVARAERAASGPASEEDS